MRMVRLLIAAGMTMTTLAATASFAEAETITIQDPAGDGLKGDALDITGVTLRNGPRAIRIHVSFDRVAPGDLALYIRKDGSRRDVIGVLSKHRKRGDTSTLLSANSKPCRALQATWDEAADDVHVVVPSRCFQDGSYDAVRLRLITEIGSDADLAPGTGGTWPWSRSVARGTSPHPSTI